MSGTWKEKLFTVSAKTFLYVSQSFSRTFWLSSASFSFTASSYKKENIYSHF